MVAIKIGIIGGSGLNDPKLLKNSQEKVVTTPYGDPSDALLIGEINGTSCILLARHGRKHTVNPSNVNYRANIWALKQEGCTHVLASTACGGLQDHTHPGDFVVLDQFIDRTQLRQQTFYDGQPGHLEGVCHIPMADPFCEHTRKILIEAAQKVGVSNLHTQGCVLTIEGPRFSSRQESKIWHQWGADVINMTSIPEVVLAKEAGLCYAALAMVTDYDSWKDDQHPVQVSNVLATFKKNAEIAKNVFITAVDMISKRNDWDNILTAKQDLVLSARQDLATNHS